MWSRFRDPRGLLRPYCTIFSLVSRQLVDCQRLSPTKKLSLYVCLRDYEHQATDWPSHHVQHVRHWARLRPTNETQILTDWTIFLQLLLSRHRFLSSMNTVLLDKKPFSKLTVCVLHSAHCIALHHSPFELVLLTTLLFVQALASCFACSFETFLCWIFLYGR